MFNFINMKTSLLHDQIRVYLAFCIRNNREGNYGFWLKQFCEKYHGDANDITDDHIDDFLVDVGCLYFGQHSLTYAERAVRGLRTYYMARSRNLAQSSSEVYDSAMAEKKLRNKQLIKLRKEDPEKWSWRNLGEYFNIHFTTAKNIYVRSVQK